ncbi:hypothetical protein DSO57_1004161 [Entomophthora muscae]|uniref:Uncharacterized protein n=1 Tax=Entomophthora muscae TaxID=34485 RepID=A0ACC2UHB5_9FUNG|nr:hypothetical protein DSO57_1004161 [Entomophthora muscae]
MPVRTILNDSSVIIQVNSNLGSPNDQLKDKLKSELSSERLFSDMDGTGTKVKLRSSPVCIYEFCSHPETLGFLLSERLIILLLLKPGPKVGIQTLTLNPRRLLALWTKEPPQAEAKNDGLNGKASQTKEISTPKGGNKTSTISFMSLKSTLVANQEPSPEGGMGLWPGPMTKTIEQDNQVANLRSLTNERTPGPGAILPPLNQSTLAHLSQYPDEPPMENIKFGSGVLYRPKDPVLQTYCHF